MSDRIRVRDTICIVTECGSCGIVYTVPETLYNERWQEGGYNYCPNGHGWGWSKDNCESEKTRRERDRLKQQMAQRDDEIASERRRREAAEQELVKRKKQVTKLRKRAAAGTCPCCRRTFSDMTEHMKRQHPEFVEATGANVVPLNNLSTALNARNAAKARS